MLQTNFDELVPKRVLFTIRQIEDLGIMKSDFLKKMILHKQIEVTKLGNKNHISRDVLISYLERNTTPVMQSSVA